MFFKSILRLLGVTALALGMFVGAPPAIDAVSDSDTKVEAAAEAHTTVTVAYRSGNVGSVRVQLHNGNFANVAEGSQRSSVHRYYQRANTCVRKIFSNVPYGRYCTGSTGRWVETKYGGAWRLYDYEYNN